MKLNIKDFFTPNKRMDATTRNVVVMCWIALVGIIWVTVKSSILPKPWDILISMKDLIMINDFIGQLTISMTLCVKAMLYSTIISLFIAYASVLPSLRPVMLLVARARFLGTVGLTFLFAQIMADASGQKTGLLVFSVTVFLVTSFLSVIQSVTKDDLDYARTLRMNEWQTLYEVIIRGKASDMFDCVRQNFAMAWMMLSMVETICRSDGGIGVILTDQNKHFRLDAVYAIQIVILLVGIGTDQLLAWARTIIFPYSTLKSDK